MQIGRHCGERRRAIGRRCEPGVGGRLLELHSEDASDALELGRITTWQPGALLAWDSSVDDVAIEVRFDPVADGTRVTVTATIPAGGADHGGTSWVRVAPSWLGWWCARRDRAARVPAESGRLALAVYYAKPATAARWLAGVFYRAYEAADLEGNRWTFVQARPRM
jgi:hypothetical protein